MTRRAEWHGKPFVGLIVWLGIVTTSIAACVRVCVYEFQKFNRPRVARNLEAILLRNSQSGLKRFL